MSASKIVKGSFLIIVSLTGLANSGGSPGGKTGSPTDIGTCGAQNCHGEQTPTQFDLITTNIPAEGYLPSHTYTITISGSKLGIDKYGFELVAEDAAGNAVGKFTGNAEVTSYISNRRATHKSTSNVGVGGRSWNVQWHAPSAGTGTITFYSACLAANGNANNFGDSVLIDQHEVFENTMAGIDYAQKKELRTYPNPCTDFLHIDGLETLNPYLELYSISGQCILNKRWNNTIDVSTLPAGSYVLVISEKGTTRSTTFEKRF